MSGWLLLLFALIGAALVANAVCPSRGPVSLLPSWLGVFLTTDLAFHHIGLQVVIILIFNWFGAIETVPGTIAIVIMIASSLALIRIWLPSLQARTAVDEVADELGLEEVDALPRSLLYTPFLRTRRGVEVTKDIEFFRAAGRSLNLDVYQANRRSDNRPALIYVHGGGWLYGDKKDQGLPLCNHLATLGWVCFNVNYRLSPGATWPEHLVDVKAAIAWVREHADEYGVDAKFIAVSGGSAGGQIAAMAALTPGAGDLQPGFEDADTSVQSVVTSYTVYDLTNRLGVHNPEFITRMIGPLVVKAFPDTEAEKFSAASPRDHVNAATVPWLVIHGSNDELAPVAEARDFFGALGEASSARCGFAELPGASHAFDIYYCHRAMAAVDLTARFLATSRSSSKDASIQSA